MHVSGSLTKGPGRSFCRARSSKNPVRRERGSFPGGNRDETRLDAPARGSRWNNVWRPTPNPCSIADRRSWGLCCWPPSRPPTSISLRVGSAGTEHCDRGRAGRRNESAPSYSVQTGRNSASAADPGPKGGGLQRAIKRNRHSVERIDRRALSACQACCASTRAVRSGRHVARQPGS